MSHGKPAATRLVLLQMFEAGKDIEVQLCIPAVSVQRTSFLEHYHFVSVPECT